MIPASVETRTRPMYVGPSGSSAPSGRLYSPGDFSTSTSTFVIFISRVLADDVERQTFPADRCEVQRNHHAGFVGVNLERRGSMIGEIVHAADQVAVAPLRPRASRRAPRCRIRGGDIVA